MLEINIPASGMKVPDAKSTFMLSLPWCFDTSKAGKLSDERQDSVALGMGYLQTSSYGVSSDRFAEGLVYDFFELPRRYYLLLWFITNW